MVNIMDMITDYNMVLVYCAIAIVGLLLLEGMSKALRYLAVVIIAFLMWLFNNPCVQLPSWILALLP